jgi:hypothetical protein
MIAPHTATRVPDRDEVASREVEGDRSMVTVRSAGGGGTGEVERA